MDKGHVLPTIGFCRSLIKGGYEVVYVGIDDYRETITAYGFTYISIFEEFYPSGYVATQTGEKKHEKAQLHQKKPHIAALLDGALDRIIEDVRPAMLIVSAFLSLEALLLRYRYMLFTAIFTPYIPDTAISDGCVSSVMRLSASLAQRVLSFLSTQIDGPVRSLKDHFSESDTFPELIACAAELAGDPGNPGGRRIYIGGSVREPNPEMIPEQISAVCEGRKIIYISLGSQTSWFPQKAAICFDKVIEMANTRECKELFFIIVTGSGYVDRVQRVHQNCLLLEWAPQIELLEKSAAAIVHGGLGSVKECIYCGVPMMLYPLLNDGPGNARRVESNKLGIVMDFEKCSLSELVQGVRTLLYDTEIRTNMLRFKEIFHTYEVENRSARAIDHLLTQEIQLV